MHWDPTDRNKRHNQSGTEKRVAPSAHCKWLGEPASGPHRESAGQLGREPGNNVVWELAFVYTVLFQQQWEPRVPISYSLVLWAPTAAEIAQWEKISSYTVKHHAVTYTLTKRQ